MGLRKNKGEESIMPKRIFLIVLTVALISSCDMIQTFELEEPFSVQYNGTAVNFEEDISITLQDVADFICTAPECPAPPPMIIANLKFEKNGNEKIIDLAIPNPTAGVLDPFIENSAEAMGYLVEFIELSDPKFIKIIDRSDPRLVRSHVVKSAYKATLRVSKLDPDE